MAKLLTAFRIAWTYRIVQPYINKFQFLQVPDKENLEEELKKEEEERRRQEEEAEERKRIQVWPFFSFFNEILKCHFSWWP